MGQRKRLENSAKLIWIICIVSMVFGNSNLFCVNVIAADSYEPDDTYTQASVIPTDGTLQSHTFDPANDEDWVVFTAALDQYYVIETHNLGDADTILYLYDSDGTTELESDDDGSSEPLASRIEWIATSTDDFYVKAIEFYGDGGPTYTYDINVTESVGPQADIYEPDDSPAEATSTPVDGTIQSHNFHISGDEDWLIFAALDGYMYSVGTFNLGDAFPVLQLYDTDGTTQLESGWFSLEWIAERTDDFYIRVIDFWGSSGSTVTYDINISESLPPPPDNYEPDNTYSDATPIPVDGTTQSHSFHIPDDEDWLIFSAIGGYLYEITTYSWDPVPLLELYDSDGTSYLDGSLFSMDWTAPRSDYFYIQVTEFLGNSGESYTYDIYITETAPPSAPENLMAETGFGFVNLTWDPPLSDGGAPVTNYRIYRNTTTGQETFYTQIGNQLNYNDTDVSNGVTYFYSVSAVNNAGEGTKTDEIQATPATYPTQPRNLRTSVGDQYINLSWDVPESDGGLPITKYNIYRGEDAENKGHLEVDFGNLTYFNDTGLVNGVLYFYNVSAENAIGEGPWSSDINATPVSVPSKPRNLEISSGDSYLNLSWMLPSSDGGSPITNYLIYKGRTSGDLNFLNEIGDVRFYNDTKVTNGVTYYYQVCAVNDVDEGELCEEVSAVPITVPTPPRNIDESFGDSYIMLSWSAPLSSGGSPITNYVIYRSTNPDDRTLLTEIENVTEYNDTTVKNGVTYYYNISAKNSLGELE
jgi:fibronectin type 3 domain-containing protein